MYDPYAAQYNLPQQAGGGGWAPGNMGTWPVSPTNSGRGQQQTGDANAPAGLLPAAGAYFQSPIRDYYPGQAIAGLNPIQRAAYESQLGAAQSGADLAKAFSSQMLSRGFNPYMEQVVQNYQRLMNQQFAENQLPNLRGTAVQAGGIGGSRQALEEALASQRLNQTIGEQTGNLLQSGWEKALTLTPGIISQVTQQRMLPGQIQQSYGSANQELQQQRINAEMARWNWYRDAAARRLNQYQQNLSAGSPYTSGTSSSTGSQTSPSTQGGLFGNVGNVVGSALYASPYLSSAFGQSSRTQPAPIVSGSSTLVSPATATGGAPIYSY